MAKRFTDTDKWKKPFIKSLPPKLKLLWFYILDDCDMAGVWQVDIEVAELRTGFKIDTKEVLSVFGDQIVEISNGEKWFIPSFIEFQYGRNLSKSNNVFASIDKILSKYDLYKYLTVEITDVGTTISSFRSRLSQKTKDAIMLECEFTCQYCSTQKPKAELVIDHIIPLNKGGDNSDGNLTCACVRCNSHKTDMLPDKFLSSDYDFINPTQRLKAAFNLLKGANKPLQGAKDKAMDKDKELDIDKELLQKNKEYLSAQFDIFWGLYNKGSKIKTRERFMKLTPTEVGKIQKHLKHYFAANPEVKFRKDAERYISHKVWETEIAQATLPEGWFNMDLTPEQMKLVPAEKLAEKKRHDVRRQMGI